MPAIPHNLEQAGEHVSPSSCKSSTSQLLPLGILQAGQQIPVSGGALEDTHGTLWRNVVLSTWMCRRQEEGDTSCQEPGEEQSPVPGNKSGPLAASLPFQPSL